MIKESNTIAASEILLEELAADIARVSAVGARAFTAGEFEFAAQLLDKARGLTSLLADLQTMSARVQSALADVSEHLDPDLPETTTLREPAPADVLANATPPPRQRGTRRRGTQGRTRESAYRVPILRSLVALGGRGTVQAVLDRVYEQMEDMLTEHDHQEVRSGELRWRNTACWERKRLVEEGLLRRDSPHGIWAISDQGRVWLARQNEAMQ